MKQKIFAIGDKQNYNDEWRLKKLNRDAFKASTFREFMGFTFVLPGLLASLRAQRTDITPQDIQNAAKSNIPKDFFEKGVSQKYKKQCAEKIKKYAVTDAAVLKQLEELGINDLEAFYVGYRVALFEGSDAR